MSRCTCCADFTFTTASRGSSNELSRLATLLALVVLTVTLMIVTSHDDWRAEVIPLMLFGMTMAIAYQREFALLLTAAVTLISVAALGHELADAIVLMATTAGAILLLGRVRSRSKLLSVGFVAAGVAVLDDARRRHAGRRPRLAAR